MVDSKKYFEDTSEGRLAVTSVIYKTQSGKLNRNISDLYSLQEITWTM